MTETLRISDIIPAADLEQWREQDLISIEAGTDTGKTYFITHRFTDFCRERNYKVLYLSPRVLLNNQVAPQLDNDIIQIMTYQAIENGYENGIPFELGKALDYDFIVCDEAHYFFSDSRFNKYTDISFREICDAFATKIFISATMGGVKDLAIDTISKYNGAPAKIINDYKIPNRTDHIDSLLFFQCTGERKEEAIHRMIETSKTNIKPNSKVLVIVDDVKAAYNLHQRYPDSMFVCSEGNRTFARYRNEDAIARLTAEERFECKYLFATPALDVGFNIKDAAVDTIIISVFDPNTVIQALGRKRVIDDADRITVYVQDYTAGQIGMIRRNNNKAMAHADFYTENGEEAYKQAYIRRRETDPTNMVYYDIDTSQYTINYVMYEAAKQRKKFLDYLDTIKSAQPYAIALAQRIGIKKIFNTVTHKQDLLLYLIRHAGMTKAYPQKIILYNKEDRRNLIELIDARDDGKRKTHRERLNIALQCSLDSNNKFKVSDFIIKERDIKDPNGKRHQHAWEICCVNPAHFEETPEYREGKPQATIEDSDLGICSKTA